MLMMETVIEHVASVCNLAPHEVRERNMYQVSLTHVPDDRCQLNCLTTD